MPANSRAVPEPLPGFGSRRRWKVLIVSLLVLIVALLLTLTRLPTYGWETPVISWAIAGLALFAVLYFAFLLRLMIRHVRENADATALLNAGEVDQAIAAYTSLMERSRLIPRHWATFRANLGTAHLRKADPETARQHIEAARNSGWIKSTPFPASRVPTVNLALCYGLLGNFERARELRAEAAANLKGDPRGYFSLFDVWYAARNGNFAEAARVAEADWNFLEGLGTGFHMRSMRLLRAFALSRGANPNPQLINLLVEGARPSRPGEFEYLAYGWPEFRSFLVEHGFAA